MNEPGAKFQTNCAAPTRRRWRVRTEVASRRDSGQTFRTIRGRSICASAALRFPALLLGLFFFSAVHCVTSLGAAKETQVKAVWLYKFLSYADWPKEAFQSDTSPFILGIIGDPEIAEILRPVANKKVKNRPIELKQFESAATARQSHTHVLFIGASEQSKLKEILEELSETSTLTVGETADFTERGGIINLTFGDAKPLAINLSAMERSGIKLHSKLKELSKLIK